MLLNLFFPCCCLHWCWLPEIHFTQLRRFGLNYFWCTRCWCWFWLCQIFALFANVWRCNWCCWWHCFSLHTQQTGQKPTSIIIRLLSATILGRWIRNGKRTGKIWIMWTTHCFWWTKWWCWQGFWTTTYHKTWWIWHRIVWWWITIWDLITVIGWMWFG